MLLSFNNKTPTNSTAHYRLFEPPMVITDQKLHRLHSKLKLQLQIRGFARPWPLHAPSPPPPSAVFACRSSWHRSPLTRRLSLSPPELGLLFNPCAASAPRRPRCWPSRVLLVGLPPPAGNTGDVPTRRAKRAEPFLPLVTRRQTRRAVVAPPPRRVCVRVVSVNLATSARTQRDASLDRLFPRRARRRANI